MRKLLAMVAVVGVTLTANVAGANSAAGLQGRYFAGAVVSVGHGSLTLKVDRTGSRNTEMIGQTVTVLLPAGTPIGLGKRMTPTAPSAVQVGWRAGVLASGSRSAGWSALRVHVWGTAQKFVFGDVTAVGAHSITLAVQSGGKRSLQLGGAAVTFTVDSATQMLGGKSRIEVGDRVGALVAPVGKGLRAIRVRDTGRARSK